jgi:hypothetical protein
MDLHILLFTWVVMFLLKLLFLKSSKKGYYWPSIFRYSYKFSRYCDKCQKFSGEERLSSMLLQPILPDFPFSKWGLEFIDPINPLSSAVHVIILKTTYYFTKRNEFVPLEHSEDEQVICFLETTIFSRFGIPL